MSRFLQEPPSARLAASVIVVATLLITAVGGVLMRLFDGGEYPSVWIGMWWVAVITSTFITRAAREREDARAAAGDEVRIEAKLDSPAARLERHETVLGGTPKA